MSKRAYEYKIDKNNKLSFKELDSCEFKPIKGSFKINPDNNLAYKIDESINWKKRYGFSDEIALKGDWNLDSDHNLKLSFKKEKNLKYKTLKFNSNLTALTGESLIFDIKSKDENNISTITYLKLKGSLNADKLNRLNFQIKKDKRGKGITLNKAWGVNKSNEVIYDYNRLGSNKKHILTLKGAWDISGPRKLGYILEGSNKKSLSFKVNLGTLNLYPKKGAIKYNINVGCGRKQKENIVIFKGTWKLGRMNSLIFETDLGMNNIKRIYFSYLIRLKDKNSITFSLYDNQNKPLGASVTFKKGDLSKDNFQRFLRLKKEGKDTRLEVGSKWRF